jgi:hypothetical protein
MHVHIFYQIGVDEPITPDELLLPLPEIFREALVVFEGRTPIWRYNLAFPDSILYVLTEEGYRQSLDQSVCRKHPELRRSLRLRAARDRRSRSGLWI